MLLKLLRGIILCIFALAIHIGAQTALGQNNNSDQVQFNVRILAIFTGTPSDLGLDHRLGRQVLKLATARARRLNPEVSNIELSIHNENVDCKSSSEIPNKVADQFYINGSGNNDEEAGNCYQNALECVESDIPSDQTKSQSAIVDRFESFRSFRKRVDAILGPSCDHLIDTIARMAAYWRTPIYTVTSISGKFGRKDIYPTLTRLSPSIDHLSLFIMKIMERFKWRHLAIVVDRNRTENLALLNNLETTIERLRYSIPIERKTFAFSSFSRNDSFAISTKGELDVDETIETQAETYKYCTQESRDILRSVRKLARVILLLLNDSLVVRRLLLCAHELQLNNGEYTFLALNLGFKSTTFSKVPSSQQQTSTRIGAMQNFDWFVQDDEEGNLRARQMFESLMIFSVELPISDEFNIFVERTLDMAHQDYPEVRFDRSSVGPIAVALHDSLLLAVEAQKRSYMSANSALSHANITYDTSQTFTDDDFHTDRVYQKEVPLMWNEHYTDGLMTSLHINSNGDQELDYTLSDMEPELGVMRPVASYSKEARQVQMMPNTYIHWPVRTGSTGREVVQHDDPPPDEPECGFTGEAEKCIDRQNLLTALTIFSLFLMSILFIMATSFKRYQKIKYQMQLDDYWWKINWSDLEFLRAHQTSLNLNLAPSLVRQLKTRSGTSIIGSVVSSAKYSPGSGKGSQKRKQAGASDTESAIVPYNVDKRRSAISLVVTPASGQDDKLSDHQSTKHDDRSDIQSRASQTLAMSQANRSSLLDDHSNIIRSELSTVVRMSSLAIYKGEIVIAKQLNGTSIEVSRNLLVELKSMRELSNENLARLVGLCIEPDHLAIVYEYCSRGNLQDLLLNQSISMDWNLKYSIIGDIINGLNFIHTTLLDYHGRLKSTNLVLDSRFTVKLTDFGLKSLYSQLELIENRDKDETTEEHTFDMNDDVGTVVTGADGDDDKLRRQSMAQTIYNMDSVSMRAENLTMPSNMSGRGHHLGDSSSVAGVNNISKMRLKNRGSARFFWTAPEHLRQRQPHLAGSKRGDIYSLAIILYEIFTRKEPYYFGTNAKPRWQVIKRDKLRRQAQLQQEQVIGYDEHSGSRLISSRQSTIIKNSSQTQAHDSNVSASQSGGRSLKQSVMSRAKKRRSQASVGPSANSLAKQESVDRAEIESCSSHPSSLLFNSVELAAGMSSGKQSGPDRPIKISVNSFAAANPEPDTIGEEEDEVLSITSRQVPLSPGKHRKVSTTSTSSHDIIKSGKLRSKDLSGDQQGSGELDAEEILDQLRMSVQPEPIRPYIPNYLLQDVNPRMMDLLRSCWHEQPNVRPNALQVRNSMRKITKGATAKNYLDNLLDRLQTYANQLERIVDSKSADIMAEKMRTEELLYQLVPKFVADKLKQNEPIIPQVFDGVTIFFSDIVGFEKYASVMSPCELVDLLNNIYSSFESIISSFDVTKIEVILDQFLVAAGISLQQQPEDQPMMSAKDQTKADATDRSTKTDQTPQGNATVKSKRSLLRGLRGSQNSEDKSNNKSFGKQSGSLDQNLTSADGEPQSLVQGKQSVQENNLQMGCKDHFKRSSAEQIARMALCIRDLVKSFHFRQNLNSINATNQSQDEATKDVEKSTEQQEKFGGGGGSFIAATFNIRIGIHSGKVCAGIVGLKRPKFCLIGDTVNVASRMHTNSKANRIQISADTRELLRQIPGFNISPRGRIEIKGKGMMETYWLESSY